MLSSSGHQEFLVSHVNQFCGPAVLDQELCGATSTLVHVNAFGSEAKGLAFTRPVDSSLDLYGVLSGDFQCKPHKYEGVNTTTDRKVTVQGERLGLAGPSAGVFLPLLRGCFHEMSSLCLTESSH